MISRERLNRIFGLALPIIGGMVSQNILNVVDTAMVGTLGDAALAAVGLGGFVAFMSQAMILGISTGVQATAARRIGEGRPDRATYILNTALLLVLLIAPVLSFALVFGVDNLYPYLNSDPAVIEAGVPYLQARILAIVFVGMNFAFRGYWNALDMSRIYMFTLIVMHAINILLNYVLIFGNFGAPALGATGAGIASAIAMACGTLIYFALGLRYARKDGFLRGLANKTETHSLIRLSIPSGLQQFFFSAGFVATMWIIGLVGTAELAAAHVLITVMLVALLPGLGLGLACMTLVGQALGRLDTDDAYCWAWDVGKVSCVVMTVLGLPMILIPDLVLSVFMHDPATRALAEWPMRLVGLMLPFEAWGFATMHALLSAGDAKRVMFYSIFYQWVIFLPVAYFIGPALGFGLFAIWAMQGTYRLLQSGTFVLLWRRRAWESIKI